MGIKDQAKRVASGASVALATSGLSSCTNNGAVDPPPPPLQCNTVNMGQRISASATRVSTRDIAITIRIDGRWEVSSITDVAGGTITGSTLPAPRSTAPLTLMLRLATDTTTQATFAVNAIQFSANTQCNIRRTFTVTVSPQGVQIGLIDLDALPLAARQRAEIALLSQAGHVVELEARTPFLDYGDIAWRVTAGELDANSGARVHWTLPPTPGIYQAELVIDYGADGLGYDVLLIEVV